MELAAHEKKRLEVARRMFLRRFPDEDVQSKSLSELMGMEGKRVRASYDQFAQKYKVEWSGRSYVPGKSELSDITNNVLTSANAALYGILTSAIYAMGYSPHIGFVHSGSPLPFVYDMADLYKEKLCIDLAFYLTAELCGIYNKYKVAEEFRKRVIEMDLLGLIGDDIKKVLEV
jgi:CRISPR-associated protein Cas1